MGSRRSIWYWTGALTIAGCLGGAGLGRAQFTSFNDRSRNGLEGNWMSCREGGSDYSEKIYDAKWPGLPPFELHLGPYHDFAIFPGIQDEHRDHGSRDNLLNPHTVELAANRARQTWEVAGLRLEVSLAGGSRSECESWYVRLQPLTSSH